jgi:arginase
VQTRVRSEFGVEGGREQAALADGHHLALVLGKRLDLWPKPGHDRGANEDGGERLLEALHIKLLFETVDLGAEGVALDRDVEQTERVLLRASGNLLGHEDHAHAGAPEGHAFAGASLQRLAEAVPLQEQAHGGAFASGQDRPADSFQIFHRAHFGNAVLGQSASAEGFDMLLEVSLNRQDADLFGHGRSLAVAARETGSTAPDHTSPITGAHAPLPQLKYTPRVVELIGAPMDYCSARQGSRLGPGAARLAGLQAVLEGVGLEARDRGDILVRREGSEPGGIRNFEAAFECHSELKRRVLGALQEGQTPLVLGGDHSNAIGSVSGALQAFGGDLAVLWVDAHADVNTPETSPSGNLHGMPMAALLGLPSGVSGLPDEQWRRIQSEVVPETRLRAERAAWFGLRDVDEGERRHYREIRGEFTATMYDVDRHGVVRMLERFDEWMRKGGASRLWISFDVDALDPILAPGTGTAVRGGLSYREMHLMGELLCEMLSAGDCPYRLAGLDVVEINPLFDANNVTARTAVEWIGSLFGKTILGRR